MLLRTLQLVVLVLATASSTHACSALDVTWQNNEYTDMRDYQSPWPLYNLMVPSREQALAREIEDLFLQEDQSTYPDGGTASMRNDMPLEDYFQEKVTQGQSGNPLYRTYGDDNLSVEWGTRRPHHPAPMQTRSLQIEDITTHPDKLIYAFYSIKMTGGLIYKTDQTKCGTAYAHPASYLEMDPSHTNNHGIFLDPSGQRNIINDDTYCFFILIPGSKNREPYIAKVNELDEDSRQYIEAGLSPYLRLKNELVPKLQDGKGDLFYAKGRYLLGYPEGKMILPHNGLNLLFNRVVLWRFYHFDRHKLTSGNDVSTRVWNELDRSLVMPVPSSINLNQEDMFSIPSAPITLNGLAIGEDLVTYFQPSATGGKTLGWGIPVGPQYLAMPTESNPRKEFPFAMHFPEGPSERAFIQGVLDDSLPINENRSDSKDSSSYGQQALAKGDLAKELTDGRRFQLYMKTDYELSGGSAFKFSAGDDSLITCDQSPEIKEFCDKYKPLIIKMEELFQQIGSSIPYNNTEPVDFRDPSPQDLMLELRDGAASSLYNFTSPTAISWQVHPALIKIQALLDDNLYREFELDQRAMNGNFNKFMNRTETGRKLSALNQKIQESISKDDKRYADEYFTSSLTEHGRFIKKIEDIESACIGKPTTEEVSMCFQTSIYDIKKEIDIYAEYETTGAITAGSFRYYTGIEESGKKLLTKLAMIQFMNGEKPDNVNWHHILPGDNASKKVETDKYCNIQKVKAFDTEEAKRCVTFFKEKNNVPIYDDKDYALQRHRPGAEVIE